MAQTTVARLPVPVALLDSGSTIHVFCDGRFLRNIRYPPFPKVIRVADGRPVQAYVLGDIETENIQIKNVYLVPALKMNLVSVKELAKAGITSTFDVDGAVLRKGEQVVGRATSEGDNSLYRLTCLRATGDDASSTSSGSEPGMVAAVYGSNLPCLEEVFHFESTVNDFWSPKGHFNSPLQTLDDLADVWAKDDLAEKWRRMSQFFKNLDDTAVYSAFQKPGYSQYPALVSKEVKDKLRVQYPSLVSKEVSKEVNNLRQHETEFIKSLKD